MCLCANAHPGFHPGYECKAPFCGSPLDRPVPVAYTAAPSASRKGIPDMQASALQWVAAGLFAAALVHTFMTKSIERLAHHQPRHAGALHLLGEVEVVFGFWAAILIITMALMSGSAAAIDYAESRQFAEPLFVFFVMVIAASGPVLSAVSSLMALLTRLMPMPAALAQVWLGLAAVPLLGSLITEPAAMTLCALMLRKRVFTSGIPGWMSDAAR